MKKCKECGITKEFSDFTKHKQTKDGYESKCKKCRQDARKIHTRNCVECGITFKTATKTSVRCSQACVSASRVRKVTLKCLGCGGNYETVPSRINTSSFCSSNCKWEYQSTLIGELNFSYNRIPHDCDGCGKKINVKPSVKRNQKYIFCGKSCYQENIGSYFSGENNPNYCHVMSEEDRVIGRNIPGYSNWRSEVLKRDKHTCKVCSNTEKEMHAHHLYNYSSHKELRTVVSNGVSLCVDCHREFHSLYGIISNNPTQFDEFKQSRQANSEPSAQEIV